MAINFEAADITGYNAANPCCCPLPECVFATIETDHRDAQECKGGYAPFDHTYAPYETDFTEPYPDSFDQWSNGVLVPVYLHKTVSHQQECSATKIVSGELYGNPGNILTESWNYTATTAFDFTVSVESEYQKPREDWDAGNWPRGSCPPLDSIFAASPPAELTVVVEAEEEPAEGEDPPTTRTVGLSWTDDRPDDPEDETAKIGYYEIRIDGSSHVATGAAYEIDLLKTDTTCHEFQVRHAPSSTYPPPSNSVGKWSAVKVFSLNDNPCCQPKKLSCTTETTGNDQSTLQPEIYAEAGQSWTTSYTVSGSATPHSGKFFACSDDPLATFYSPSSTLVTTPRPALYLIFELSGYTEEKTTLPESKTQVFTWDVNHPNTSGPASPVDHSWQVTVLSEIGTAVETFKTELTVDQNEGSTTTAGMFGTLLGTFSGYDDSYGWGTTITATIGGVSGWVGSDEARAVEQYPETDGSGSFSGTIIVRMRQLRFRWYVPEEHLGTAHTTRWDIARFPDKWVKWRADYYDWAVKKYTFLHKPEPGDDDYPVHPDEGDFPDDDPETEDYNEHTDAYNDAVTGYDDAVQAINDIEDPGDAPTEPEEQPVVIESDEWVWASDQGYSEQETIDDCDPTKYGRELHEPEEPSEGDFEDHDDYVTAHDAWETAHQDWEDEVDRRHEATKRQSAWFFVTPDRASDYRKPPFAVAPLPAHPTADQIAVHDRAVTIYNNRLARYNSGIHEGVRICNVRHICGETPAGNFENYDHQFPTTEVPPLDPAHVNPERWGAWY